MDDDYLTCTTGDVFPKMNLSDMQAIVEKFDKMRQRELLRWGRIFDQMQCTVCGRKPFMFKSAGRDTIGCCEHIYGHLKAVTREPAEPHTGQPSLWAIGIEVVS